MQLVVLLQGMAEVVEVAEVREVLEPVLVGQEALE
jgi:hypothetical protein